MFYDNYRIRKRGERSINLFIDFDGTIVNSIKTYCQAYNNLYFERDDFVEADYTKVNKFNFADQCPLACTQEKIREIFASCEFWSWLEFMPNAKEILRGLNKQFNITIVSIGTYLNLSRKAKWISQHLPFIHNCILINNGNNFMDKSIVNMSGGILIDDVASNLETSNATYKICFGQTFDWNKDLPEGCIRTENWWETEKILNKIITQKGDFVERR